MFLDSIISAVREVIPFTKYAGINRLFPGMSHGDVVGCWWSRVYGVELRPMGNRIISWCPRACAGYAYLRGKSEKPGKCTFGVGRGVRW